MHWEILEGSHRLKIDYSAVAVKSRCVAPGNHIALIVNVL